MLLPFNLNFEPDVPVSMDLFGRDLVIPSCVILFTGWLIHLAPSRIIKFASLWVLITILPTSSFIPLKQLAAEHRMYFPGIGVILIISICFKILGSYWWKMSSFLFIGFVCVSGNFCTPHRGTFHVFS